jgi:hypothetical protein
MADPPLFNFPSFFHDFWRNICADRVSNINGGDSVSIFEECNRPSCRWWPGGRQNLSWLLWEHFLRTTQATVGQSISRQPDGPRASTYEIIEAIILNIIRRSRGPRRIADRAELR